MILCLPRDIISVWEGRYAELYEKSITVTITTAPTNKK